MTKLSSAPRHRVLVVDDIELNVAVISALLRESNYDVTAAFSGATALRAIQRRQPEIILLDVMMPEMDGFEVCRILKENPETAQIPIIFISALSDIESKVKSFEVGGVDFISKPFQGREVLARVSTHLRIRSLEQEQEQMIAKLQMMNEEKDRLLQIASHDLRSPLSNIRTIGQMLKAEQFTGNTDDVKEFGEMIERSASILISLVTDILDIAKVESGKFSLTYSKFCINDLLRQCVQFLQSSALIKNISVQLRIPNEQLIVEADEPKMMQIINNLLSNAIKFTPQGGTISLSLIPFAPSENSFTITIQDSGIGIPEEFKDKIFEKFGKHQRSGTNGENGTGLGMPIIRSFVELHRGSINFTSTEGIGTTFILSFPIGYFEEEE